MRAHVRRRIGHECVAQGHPPRPKAETREGTGRGVLANRRRRPSPHDQSRPYHHDQEH
jgi:hypothetical protein